MRDLKWLVCNRNAHGKAHEKLIVDLLAAEADVNARDRRKLTALMMAHRDYAVKLLLAAGADINAKDVDGHTALTWAKKNGRIEGIIKLLYDAGAEDEAAIVAREEDEIEVIIRKSKNVK